MFKAQLVQEILDEGLGILTFISENNGYDLVHGSE